MAAQIELREVRKEYATATGPVLALAEVSLSVRPREFLTLLGPSGCGLQDTLLELGVLKTRLPLADHYTTEFTPVRV